MNRSRERKVSCVYVVGVAGLATYTTHFSVLTKATEQVSHMILKEGEALHDEVLELEPKYFMITLNDPNISKLTI